MNRATFLFQRILYYNVKNNFNIVSAFFNIMHTRLFLVKNDTPKKTFVDIMKASETRKHDEVE